jgi:hypothetical protein
MSPAVPRPAADIPEEIPASTLLFAGLLTVTFLLTVVVFYEYARPRAGNVILPGGVTYLGERSAPSPATPAPASPVQLSAPSDSVWKTFTGKTNPFRFSYPETVSMALYPNAASETVVIRVGETNPTEYTFLTVLDLSQGVLAQYNGKQKELVLQYDKAGIGITSVGTVEPFTNVGGLKGYRVTLTKLDGSAEPDVFFEVPGRTDRMLRLVGSVLTPALFSRITDSVAWGR